MTTSVDETGGKVEADRHLCAMRLNL